MQNDKPKFKNEFEGRVYRFSLDAIWPVEQEGKFCIFICHFEFYLLTFDF
jgi:hypothetical protein